MTKKNNSQSGRIAESKSAANKNDVIMNRVLCVLLYTLVALISLFALHNNGNAEMFVVGKLGIPLLAVSAVLLALAIVFRIKRVKAGVNEDFKVISSAVCLYAAAVFFAVCWSYRFAFIADMDALIVAVIAAAVCYFVYYMYPSPMFWYTVATAIGLIGIRVLTNHSESAGTLALIGRVIVIAYGVVIAILAFLAQKGNGKLFGFDLGRGFKCWFTLVSAILLIVTGVIAIAIPALLGYMTIVYVAMFFVLIVVGTVLMI